jgi:hypothetical protein
MIDYLIIGAIVLIIGGALFYIIKAKKSGKRCIGCPDSASCSKCSSCHGCNGECGGKSK